MSSIANTEQNLSGLCRKDFQKEIQKEFYEMKEYDREKFKNESKIKEIAEDIEIIVLKREE